MKILLLILCLSFALTARAGDAPAAPDIAPLFAATVWDLRDRPVELATLRGRPLVVNFWARWCGPCRVEIPHFVAAHHRFKDQGLAVVGIGLEDKPDTVGEFARAYDMDYTVLLAKDRGIALLRALGNAKAGLPFTLVIGADGRVVARKLGLMSQTELDSALARLF